MKNSTAQAPTENVVIKMFDAPDLMAVVYEKHPTPAIIFSGYFPLEKKFNLFLKRTFDIILSTLLIVFFFSWLVPIISLLIKIGSGGPVFFLQKRNKRGGELFTCIKFRTMFVNNDADTLAASENDGRITGFGKFLRRNHLDELPQLMNVFWGDMSIVGPRPHMLSDNIKYESLLEYYAQRHKVKPGITGLAQVNGYVGSIVDLKNMEQRVKQDIFYIHHWSIALDIKISYRTFLRIIRMN